MPEATAEYWVFGRIFLAGGSRIWLSATWHLFDEARVVHFDATPDAFQADTDDPNWRMELEVTRQLSVRDQNGGLAYRVEFTNLTPQALVFRPRVSVIPAARFPGGGSR